jgi:hypothetical protein
VIRARKRGRWHGRISAGLLAAALVGALVSGCSTVRATATWNDPRKPVAAGSAAAGSAAAQASAGTTASATPLAPVYDVSPLLHPSKKYLGVEIPDAPDSIAPAEKFAGWVGGKPNIIGQYLAWGTSFDAAAASHAWSYGAMDFVVWEPWTTTLAQIAAGASDAYVTRFATAVRALNVPIVISFGHEFNGSWYPWGTNDATAAQFVAAWRHVHDLFATAGATNVIWIWDPNDILTNVSLPLKDYYPGDSYVDWVGVTGYWSQGGPNSYAGLYLPTLEEIREFTQKPFIIAETAVEPGSAQSQSLTNLFQAVEQHADILGFVWYDFDVNGDWRVENRPSIMSQFKSELSSGDFGFNVSEVK